MLVYWPGTFVANIKGIPSVIHTALQGFNITEVGRTQEKYLTYINILKFQPEM